MGFAKKSAELGNICMLRNAGVVCNSYSSYIQVMNSFNLSVFPMAYTGGIGEAPTCSRSVQVVAAPFQVVIISKRPMSPDT